MKLHLHRFPDFNTKRDHDMHYLTGMKEVARRQAERQALPMGQQWHLVGGVSHRRFPTPRMAGNRSLPDLNRLPGGQNADNGPHSSSSQGLRRETRRLTPGYGSHTLK